MTRILLLTPFLLLLCLAVRQPAPVSGQGAVAHSIAGHEDLTFWTHRRGLEQIDFAGEVGFGDMARVLLRRRDNTHKLLDLRDRFTFRTTDLSKLDTPDVFRARITAEGIVWLNRPDRFIAMAARVLNVPLIVENASGTEARLAATLENDRQQAVIAPGKSAGILLRWMQKTPVPSRALLELKKDSANATALFHIDNRPPAKLRVRIVDENGQPTTARIYITAADGLSYAPKGSVPRITAMSAEYFFHATGSFTMDLPAGMTRVEAARGIEYELASASINLQRDNDEEVVLRMKRWSHLAAAGWFAADSHIHMNYTAPHHQVMTPEDMKLVADGEDLAIPNFMVANSGGEFIHDRQYFEGKPHKLSDANRILYWNEEFRNSGPYGHIAYFRLKSLIEPFYTGFRNTPHADDYPANYTAAKAGKDQNAAVVYVHPGMSSGYDSIDGGAGAKEMPVDLALGVIDTMDVLSNNTEQAGMELWYRFLNCGFRPGISAGTDSFVNVTDHYLPGGHRVYVQTPNGLRYDDWVDAYRQGRSFATNGPMIRLDIDGKGPGDEIRLQGPPASLRVTAKLSTNVPVDNFDIVVNGVAVASRKVIERGDVTLTAQLNVKESAWVAARAMGPRNRLVLNDWGAFAHTSPVFVTVNGKKVVKRDDAAFFVEWVERFKDGVDKRGRFSKPEQKKEVLALCDRALAIYRRLAARGE